MDFHVFTSCFIDHIRFVSEFRQILCWNFLNFLPFFVHCCLWFRNCNRLVNGTWFVDQVVVLQRMNSFRCEMILMSSRCNSFHTQSLGFIWFQDTRHFWLVIIFNATGFLYFVPFDLFQGMARAAGTFRFYSAFPMVSSNSSSSGSMK